MVAAAAARPRLQPIPRVDGATLSLESFLRRFALPGLPVILTGLGAGWPATAHWRSLQRLAERGLDLEEVVQVQVGSGGVATMPLGKFLDLLAERDVDVDAAPVDDEPRQKRRRTAAAAAAAAAAPAAGDLPPGKLYLRNWRFHENNPHLLSDFTTPGFFSLDFGEQAGLVSPHSFTWLYLGERGSATPTHVDVMNSSAWMYVLKGRKRWRMVASSGLERCYTSAAGSGPSVQEGGDTLGGSLLDLFGESDEALAAALGADATLWEGEVGPGELIFTPSKCAHAVQNLELTIALTSNYVDLSNVMDVYDSLSGIHPNGNPLPFFHPTPEELLALCVPRALAMVDAAASSVDGCCPAADAESIKRLLQRVLYSACRRRAKLLEARMAVMRKLARSLRPADADLSSSSESSEEEESEGQSAEDGDDGEDDGEEEGLKQARAGGGGEDTGEDNGEGEGAIQTQPNRAVVPAKARCCLSCGHRGAQSSTALSCEGCGVSLKRDCPSCGAVMLNGASLCLGCMEIDNAFVGQPKARDDLALATT